MSRRSLILSLQGWLLAILLPTLGLVIVAYAILVYGRLSDFIVAGFDAKLTAISTTAAGFIDPAEHQRLVEPLPITNMTHDPAEISLWALDISEHRFLKIRETDGVAEETDIKVPPEINDITNGLIGGELYLVDDEAGHFLRYVTSARKITPAFDVPPPIYALATSQRTHSIYAAGRTLRRIDLDTGKIEERGPLAEKLRDLTCDRNYHDALYGLGQYGDEVIKIDPADARILSRKKLVLEKSDPTDTGPPQPIELKTLVCDPGNNGYFGTSTSLLRVDPDTGIVSAKGFLPAFGQERGPVYRRYATPMTHVIARANLTFLYTQVVNGRNHISYGLDGTAGPKHTSLLATDTVHEAEVAGIQRLMTEGTAYVSDSEPWPPWGLVKSSFAPIFNSQDRPVAMVGADVDAGVIQFQIRRALVITFALGAVMLIIGGALALAIARQLAGPINTIKAAALRAAAGDYTRQAEVARPRELRHLARRFSAAVAKLGKEVHESRNTLFVRQAARDRAGLVERLARIPPLALSAPPEAPWAWGSLGPRHSEGAACGGAVRAADQALLWIFHPSGDLLESAARRAEIAVTTEAVLARHGSDPAALGSALEKLFQSEVAAWALLTPGGIQACLRGPGLLFRRAADGQCSEISSADFPRTLTPGPGEALILAGPAAPLNALPAAVPAHTAAGLLAAWRAAAPESGPRAFAAICVLPSS